MLFKSATAANTKLLTDAAVEDAEAAGDVMLVPVPDLTFTCAVVPAANGTGRCLPRNPWARSR